MLWFIINFRRPSPTNNKDKSYTIAYWADEFKPYPIEVEIDGKLVSKDAKVIKLLFHPEMK